MSVWQIIIKEISHRKLNFCLSLLAVAVAVGFLTGALSLLKAESEITHWLQDQQQAEFTRKIELKEQEVQQAGAELQDAVRKITKGLGFNILILPENQDLNQLHLEGELSETFPEEYVTRLAESKIVTINHLLPMVSEKLNWEEQGMEIILTGTRGEVPFLHRVSKKPLQDQVPAGQMVIGHQIQQQLKLKTGDQVTLKGKEFEISEVREEQGTVDDSTVWINLKEAQELLDRQNLLNAILALECNCATLDRVTEIREELASVLPGTKIIERGPPALARAEARNKAKQTAEESLAREKIMGEALLADEQGNRKQREQQLSFFTTMMVAFIIICATMWLGLLTYNNVRQRRNEIAILRAFGVRSYQILTTIIGRNILIGILGAFAGILLGIVAGSFYAEWSSVQASAAYEAPLNLQSSDLRDGSSLLLVFLLAPVLALIAGWFPALLASREDPASILQSEN
ncbi:outer membrane-specific lipoprotein transporter subunit LolE [Polystyrenella longa]|uniref:Outer membrane-specific lipoprotein transporter subunit LolE n=1 Tax=Polystyrenella longa TaxID=2528007 RepID=A0A518CUI7_9PLAN|nr:FtsX-like permease family protein [Polystyrenella longa]QDU82854.1 outer membrane-specific lipoprotein transporter subunit LolE [Polystyrenella longa]